jgi:hypothetical protein
LLIQHKSWQSRVFKGSQDGETAIAGIPDAVDDDDVDETSAHIGEY